MKKIQPYPWNFFYRPLREDSVKNKYFLDSNGSKIVNTSYHAVKYTNLTELILTHNYSKSFEMLRPFDIPNTVRYQEEKWNNEITSGAYDQVIGLKEVAVSQW